MTDTHTSSKWPLLLSVLLFIGILLGTFSIQMKSALDGFDRWVGHEDHRLPNVRLVPEDCRWAVIDRFIELQPVDNADAFIFGDSQMFARGATQEEMFYTHWLGKEATVINFSFLAARISDMRKIADRLHRENLSAPRLLQNINMTQFKKSKSSTSTSQIGDDFFLLNPPQGFEKLYSNRFVCTFKMRKVFSQNSLRKPSYGKLQSNFSLAKLPISYGTFDVVKFNTSVEQHIESYKAISPYPILMTAPMAYDEFSTYDYDIKNLDEFSEAFLKLCAEYQADIHCHDLTRSITSEGFMDLIHMDAEGHKMLGQALKRSQSGT